MAPNSRATGTVVRLLVGSLLLAALATLARRAGGPDDADARAAAGEPCRPSSACGPVIYEDLASVPTVPAADACRDAAYLCEGLAGRNEPMRALRFRDDRTGLRIAVAWPHHLTRREGLAYQQAAVRGLRAWDGLPLRLDLDQQPAPGRELDTRSTTTPSGGRSVVPNRRLPQRTITVTGDTFRRGPARPTGRLTDFTVSFTPNPTSTELAEASASWGWNGTGAYDMRVSVLRVATHREAAGAPLSPQQVAAAAAHAMGHALGLPHSSSAGDVMAPGNTAVSPSVDDLAALQALYALPNGVEIAP